MARNLYKFFITLILTAFLSGCCFNLEGIKKFFNICGGTNNHRCFCQKDDLTNKNFKFKSNGLRRFRSSINKQPVKLATTSTANVLMLKKLANNYKDPHAMLKLGQIYLNGINGVPKDLVLAKSWFLKAANNGLSAGLFELGNMARDGIGEDKSFPKAIDYYKQAVTLGNVNSMLALAEIYCGIYGMKPDYNLAMEYYTKAAGMGSLEAEYQMLRLFTNKLIDESKYVVNIESIIEALRKAAVSGDPNSMLRLADYYAKNNNFKLAIEYYQKASNNNSGLAYFKLGLLYLHGEFIEKNYVKALEYFTKAASLNQIMAYYYLGEMYANGTGTDINFKLAVQYYRLAADNNFVKAVGRLADLYFLGKGVEPNIEQAIELYTKAAQANDSYSCFMLSIFYVKGLGVKYNLPISMHWYNLGVKQPDQLLSKFAIARLYEIGSGFKQNYIEAVRWYTLSAEGGFAKAQVKLGDLYASDRIDKADYNKAFTWYMKAVSQGYKYAQYSVALLLQNKTVKDSKMYKPNVAYNLMKKAALNGYGPAQYNLGLMYLHGIGTSNNFIKAYCWLSISLSSGGGYESNPELIDILINDLDFVAREKAIKLEENYKQQQIIKEEF